MQRKTGTGVDISQIEKNSFNKYKGWRYFPSTPTNKKLRQIAIFHPWGLTRGMQNNRSNKVINDV